MKSPPSAGFFTPIKNYPLTIRTCGDIILLNI